MVFFKNIEVRCLKTKYGGTHRGLFANETINPGEKIWYCQCSDEDLTFTRDQLFQIIEKHPKLEYYVRSFSYMIDDDLYAIPRTYLDEKNNDECALFNHSCHPNCGFDETGDGICAIRTIQPGDELTYHYGFLETEASLILGLICKCGSSKCDGRMTFDKYREPEFASKYFDYFTLYLKKKTLDLKERWHSTDSYIKRYPSATINNNEEWEKGLCSLNEIKKDELVATFPTDEIEEGKHYLRHSEDPNCYVKGRGVFAKVDIPSETELTIYYHGVLL